MMASTDAATQSLTQWQRGEGASPALAGIIYKLAEGCVEINTVLRSAPIDGLTGASALVNVQGEVQKQLDIITNDMLISRLQGMPAVAALVSEEEDEVIPGQPGGTYCVAFDPLDGSSNIETNSTIGTVFSVLELKGGKTDAEAVLGAYSNQVAAGYVLYGPATLMVLCVGGSVAMLALNPKTGGFEVVQDKISIAPDAAEFAINVAHQRDWQPDVIRYVEECLQGKAGPRGKNFNMRWAGSMVADVHRVFVRGGVFIYPALNKPGGEKGKLRLLYEANPMAMLIEAAGGLAIGNATRIKDVAPTSIHQRVPLAMGSANEISLLQEYAKAL